MRLTLRRCAANSEEIHSEKKKKEVGPGHGQIVFF